MKAFILSLILACFAGFAHADSPTITPSDTPTWTPTSTITDTFTFSPTITPTDTPTTSPTRTDTPTTSPTPTWTPTLTPLLTQTALAHGTETQVAIYTQTAVVHSTQTAIVKSTQTALAFTETAVVQASWTKTPTPLPTNTPAPTFTITPTFSNSPTTIPTPILKAIPQDSGHSYITHGNIEIKPVILMDQYGNTLDGRINSIDVTALNTTSGTAYAAVYITTTGNSSARINNPSSGNLFWRWNTTSDIPSDIQTGHNILPTLRSTDPMTTWNGMLSPNYPWLIYSNANVVTGSAENGHQ